MQNQKYHNVFVNDLEATVIQVNYASWALIKFNDQPLIEMLNYAALHFMLNNKLHKVNMIQRSQNTCQIDLQTRVYDGTIKQRAKYLKE
jgi:hypothetical protein